MILRTVNGTANGRWMHTAIVIAACALATAGALHLEILVDDAFIAYRYVSNAYDGHGLVWNPPPFLPVEGYTGFSWLVILWAVWAWFGIEPPIAAPWISIGCGLVAIAVCAAAMRRLRDARGQGVATFTVACALTWVATNRTFLQWFTGGLETALLNLLLLSWVVVALRDPARRTPKWIAAWSALAAACALTRPDGLLFAAMTVAAVAVEAVRRRWRVTAVLVGLLPLLAIVLHVAWRKGFYGEWLPNTYYAKVGDPWPAAGSRYFVCFLLENGGLVWFPLAAVWLGVELARGRRAFAALRDRLPGVAAVAAVMGHVGYYVIVVGGDHFEFRVMSYLIPVGGIAAVAMTQRLRLPAAAAGTVLLAIFATASVGWYQLQVTGFRTPPQYDPLEPHMPAWTRPIVRYYDRQRLWLQMHMIAMRFPHGFDRKKAEAGYPERKRRASGGDDIPVVAAGAVGWLGWLLPDIAVIDEYALNDWVGARTDRVFAGNVLFPPPLRERVLRAADPNGDGAIARAELAAAYASVMSRPPDEGAGFADTMFTLFASDAAAMTRDELAEIEPFYATLRLQTHDHRVPDEYLAAFRPNVVFGKDVRIEPRARPLRAADVVAIEAEWRERIRRQRKP